MFFIYTSFSEIYYTCQQFVDQLAYANIFDSKINSRFVVFHQKYIWTKYFNINHTLFIPYFMEITLYSKNNTLFKNLSVATLHEWCEDANSW